MRTQDVQAGIQLLFLSAEKGDVLRQLFADFAEFLFLFRGKLYVTFRHFWYSYLFLLVTVPPIYLLNSRTGQNYMFLSDGIMQYWKDKTGRNS